MAQAGRQGGGSLKATDPKLIRIARRIAVMLGPDSCVVVGAMAAAVHGYARATTDVDLIFGPPLVEARKRLAQHGVKTVLKHGDRLDGDFDCLEGTIDGIDFDVLPPLVPIDWDNAVDVPLSRGELLRVVDLTTLIHLKLRAGGPQDVLDVVMLLQRHPGELARARELATAYGLAAQMEWFMNNSRIKAKAPKVRSRRSVRPGKG